MNDSELLRRVSRSFYLTLRLLPGALRRPLSLAYLLARASDTAADATDAPPTARRALLEELRASEVNPLPQHLDPLLGRQSKPAEAELMRRLPELLESLRQSPDRAEITAAWSVIIEGQLGDLAREPAGDAMPLSRDELDLYLFQVAGCVGELWTKLGYKHLPRFAARPEEWMLEKGVGYGKGLQLVNILRDFPNDAAHGRRYLDAEVYAQWKDRAGAYLEDGRAYTRALYNRRLRYASALPLAIARRMLPRLRPDQAVKLPRWEIQVILLRTLLVCLPKAK